MSMDMHKFCTMARPQPEGMGDRTHVSAESFGRPVMPVAVPGVDAEYVGAAFSQVIRGKISLNTFYTLLQNNADRAGPGTAEFVLAIRKAFTEAGDKIPVAEANRMFMDVLQAVNSRRLKLPYPAHALTYPEQVATFDEISPKPPQQNPTRTGRAAQLASPVPSKRNVEVKHTFGLFRHQPAPETIKPEESGGLASFVNRAVTKTVRTFYAGRH